VFFVELSALVHDVRQAIQGVIRVGQVHAAARGGLEFNVVAIGVVSVFHVPRACVRLEPVPVIINPAVRAAASTRLVNLPLAA